MQDLQKAIRKENRPHNLPAILVADDTEDYRELLAAWLRAEGYTVLEASDGEMALKKVKNESVDVVLLDVIMPRRSGFATCRMLKSDPKTRLIPIVLVTTLDNKEDRIQGIEAGADDFLGKPVHKEELLARVRSLLRIKQYTDELEDVESVLFSLAFGLEANDPYTAGHSARVSKYSVALGKRVGLQDESLEQLRRAGLVHDIGKIGIPPAILSKPGSFTPEDRKLMEQHPITGERICSPLRSFRPLLPIIRHHHERLDGSGYPDGLCGDQIPLLVRIVSTADVYDALTSARPYRKPLEQKEAITLMRKEARNGWWDLALIEEYAKVVTKASWLTNEFETFDESLTDPKIEEALL